VTGSAARPIGVFDSGIGGLTVLSALMRELPCEHFTYLGDTARLPYGTKTAESVVRYSVQAAEALMDLGVKCLVVACNTASSVGLAAICERVGALPVLGVIEPGAQSACAATRTGHIAVIGTERTIREGAYQEAIIGCRRNARVSAVATQLFVALAEEGLCDGPIVQGVIRHYLDPLFQASSSHPPDTLVLGCTHFPVLGRAISTVIGERVGIVDSAETTARAVRARLHAAGALEREGRGSVQFVATDGPERFARVGSRFLGREIAAEEVDLIDL
jgi:glutamate racemase